MKLMSSVLPRACAAALALTLAACGTLNGGDNAADPVAAGAVPRIRVNAGWL